MKARIHRGAQEVGGSCVELKADSGELLVLDLGLPLESTDPRNEPMPAVEGLESGGSSDLLGVVVTHGHPDHYGLLDRASPEVPVFMGKATEGILAQAKFFTSFGLAKPADGYLADRRELKIGPFSVTPYLVDHSAFDAYALLVEADGDRLLYSGDIRAHGRKAGSFDRMVKDPPADIDTLLLEGTMVGRPPSDTYLENEEEVEERCAEVFSSTPGAALALYSAQNIDRLVSVFRAAKQSDRQLVIDLYGAGVAAATGYSSIPQASWEGVRVYVPQAQRVKVKRSGEFERVNRLGKARIYVEEMAADPSQWVITSRASMLAELGMAGVLGGAAALWMMWPGYLKGEAGGRTRKELTRWGLSPEVVHCSGHAGTADLQRFAKAIDALRLVPIHTDHPDEFAPLFNRVNPQENGSWWQV